MYQDTYLTRKNDKENHLARFPQTRKKQGKLNFLILPKLIMVYLIFIGKSRLFSFSIEI